MGGKCIMTDSNGSGLSEYIMTALLQLMEKKSFDQVSVTELCEKAGVSRMTFYRSFDGKTDVLRKKCAAITDEFVRTSGISYRKDPLRSYFTKLFTHLLNNRGTALLLLRDGLLWVVKDDIDRVFLTAYAGVYEEYKTRFITGGIFDVYRLWLENGCRETPEEMALRLSAILEK